MDQLEEIKSKIDIVELLGSYISLKKAGRNFKALCPFHSEKTPSLVISPERQIWKCFGCQNGGDVFKFLMEYEKMTFPEALKYLADKAGIKLASYKPSPAQTEKEKLLSINHLASEFYHYILLNHSAGKKGLDYLLKRGISRSSIDLFKLGYAPESWEALQNYLIGKKKYQINDLFKTGLINKKTMGGFYDYFRGRIIFPLTDHRNNILGFSGRTLLPDLQGAKYINIAETSLYKKGELYYGLSQTKEHIKKANKAIIVEGEFDVISSYQAGVKNVIAIKGSALTEPQVNLIKRYTQNIILALDGDLAGDAAVRRGIEIADYAGLNMRVVQPKYGKDPDECARHSPALWRESVDEAIPVFDFYINSTLTRFDKKSAEGKKAISEELALLLNKITNEVVKAHYIKKLADTLDVEEEIIIKEMERWARKEKINFGVRAPLQSIPLDEQTRKDKLEEILLSMLLQKEEDMTNLIAEIDLESFDNRPVKEILTSLKQYLKKHKFNINKFAKNLAPEVIEALDRIYLIDIKNLLDSDEIFLKEFMKIKKELVRLSLKQKLTELARLIREKERIGEAKGLTDLREKFTDFSKKLKEFS